MKKTCILLIFAFTLMLANTANAQQAVAQRLPASEKAIPKIVLQAYQSQNPFATTKAWYVTHLTYWQNDYSSDWYNGWYGQRTLVIYAYQKPNYFEVEFYRSPDELSRAIYNVYGYWYETRTQIRGLTMGIYDALRSSGYDKWKVSLVKEKIESPMWPVEIYRFQISKGLKSKIIRMDAEGNLIQMRDLN